MDYGIPLHTMLYPFITPDDNTQIVHSELLPDGQVRVCIEQPVQRGFNSATCMLPSYTWSGVEGFSSEDIGRFQQNIEEGAHLIFRYAETGGFPLARFGLVSYYCRDAP